MKTATASTKDVIKQKTESVRLKTEMLASIYSKKNKFKNAKKAHMIYRIA